METIWIPIIILLILYTCTLTHIAICINNKPRVLIDLALVLDLVCQSSKAKDFIEKLQKIHTATQESLKKTAKGYKI